MYRMTENQRQVRIRLKSNVFFDSLAWSNLFLFLDVSLLLTSYSIGPKSLVDEPVDAKMLLK